VTGLADAQLLGHMSTIISSQPRQPGAAIKFDVQSKNPGSPPPLSPEEMQQLQALRRRLEKIGLAAASSAVKLLVDAEQTYYQPAIDYLALELSGKFNRMKPIIHNTYQMYLVDGLKRLNEDLQAMQAKKIFLGVKLVRGAYIESERQRAIEMKYPSPVFDKLELTHESYNKGVSTLIENVRHCSVLIATHNEESVKLAYQKMKQLQIASNDPRIYFGQLYGMCDHISYGAAQQGLSVCKYIPFGPVGEVIPYLTRRMQENKGLIGRTQTERTLLSREVRRRIGL